MTMKIFRGRLFDHVHLRVASLEKSKRFYRAALAPLDIQGPGKRSSEAVEIIAG